MIRLLLKWVLLKRVIEMGFIVEMGFVEMGCIVEMGFVETGVGRKGW